jgi:transposase
MFAGIDWAADEHAVCILDAAGRVVDRFAISHTAAGFERLVRRLARVGPPDDLAIAIERPDGRLVDRLLAAGHPVVPVKTTAIKAWREAEVGSGAKSDPGDARVIADYLRLRRPDLRELRPFSAETRALRAVVRARGDLVDARVAAGNQLAATLAAFWPGAGDLFADIWSEIALAFLERYPTPAAAAHLGEARMSAFLRKHGYSGRRSPAELLERLRSAPAGLADGPESEARRDAVLAMVRVVRALNRSIKDLDRSVVAHLDEHPDAVVFRSLPRAGQVSAAQMLAEWGDCREAYDGPEAVAALSGMAPVTRRSGKHLAVGFRWACNTRFRNAMATFADNSRHASPWAAAIYQAAIDRGADHPHAVRILARSWIRVIFGCWRDGVAYDPARHGAAHRLAETIERPVAAA